MNNGFINKYHQRSYEQAIEKLNQNKILKKFSQTGDFGAF